LTARAADQRFDAVQGAVLTTPAGWKYRLDVAPLLAETKDVVTALKAYEAERRWVTAQIVQDNRVGEPERVVDVVESELPTVLQA
jgi:hypothetical protein